MYCPSPERQDADAGEGRAAPRRPGPPPPSRSSGLCCGPGCSTSPPASVAAPGSVEPGAAALTYQLSRLRAVHHFMTLATGPMMNQTPSAPSPFVWPEAVSPLK